MKVYVEKDNPVRDKSFLLGIKIIRTTQDLVNNQNEYVLSKQLMRSGTSVGAMIREAEHAESKADFIHKLSIAQKELNETLYWLDLMVATDYLNKKRHRELYTDAVEIMKLLTSIIRTTKSRMK